MTDDEQTDTKWEQERQELVEQLQRLQAEFDNFRKRLEREHADHQEAATDHLLHELLPIVDNFQLALQHAKTPEGTVNGEDLVSGIILIHDQLKTVLEHYSIIPLHSDGEKFDPSKHEALMTVAKEGVQKGHVIQTFQSGYQRNGKVFRPAKVSVAR